MADPKLSRLGLLDNDLIPVGISNPMDALVEKLASSLMMPKDETDVIIMNHSVGVRLPSGKCVSYPLSLKSQFPFICNIEFNNCAHILYLSATVHVID